VVALWHIWDARNKCREGEGVSHPKAVAAKIKAYIELIYTHLYKSKPANWRELYSLTPKWVPPPTGSGLLNVDATTFASTRHMGVGVVSRDHHGSFIASCGERYDEVVTQSWQRL
jgi:hypothetical protein